MATRPLIVFDVNETGAVAAGWGAALIRRVGNDLLGVGPQAQFVGKDLDDIADQLIAHYR